MAEPAGVTEKDQDRPTLLMVGEGELMDTAIERALDRHGLSVESTSAATVVEMVLAAAPDLVLLVGDAAVNGGVDVLRLLASNPATSVVPVAVLSDDTSLDSRLSAFRHGAVALVLRGASSDAIGRRAAEIARELPERPGEASGPLGEATLDELLELVRRELRSGILSVEGDTDATPAMRLVLGAGKPVSEALSDFVSRLKPLIEKAEPLRYELIEESGGRLQLLDPEDTSEGADLEVLGGLRVLVVDDDPARADALAQELRARRATVAITDSSGGGLDRARALDPEVVILDASELEGPGFDVVRTLRRDPRFRWAQLLVASWDEIWPNREGPPDMHRLAGRIAPLVEQDRALHERVGSEGQFDTRLEITGPSRMMRALASTSKPLHVTVRNPKALIEIDVTQGLVVGATGMVQGSQEPLEAGPALAALLVLSSGRVRVEPRANPSTANLMTPVDEALAAATTETPPIRPSLPPSMPPKDAGERPPAPRLEKQPPFPSVEELSAPQSAEQAQPVEEDPEPSGTGPLLAPHARASLRQASVQIGPQDMSWSEESTEREVVPAERDPSEETSPAPAKPPSSVEKQATGRPDRRVKARTMIGYAPPKPKKPGPAPTARKKTMLGVIPSKSAGMPSSAAKPPAVREVRPPTDDAPTVAPPSSSEKMDAALDLDTELDAVPAGARPLAHDAFAASPPSAERDDPTVRSEGPPTIEEPVEEVQAGDPWPGASEQADAVAFADTMHPGGAMVAPIEPEAHQPPSAEDQTAPSSPMAGGSAATHVPDTTPELETGRRSGATKIVAAVIGALVVLGLAGAVALFLVPGLRESVLGEEAPVAETDPTLRAEERPPVPEGEGAGAAEGSEGTEAGAQTAEGAAAPGAEVGEAETEAGGAEEGEAEEGEGGGAEEAEAETAEGEEAGADGTAAEESAGEAETAGSEPDGDGLSSEERERLSRLRADDLVRRGHAATREGDLATAEDLYRMALEKDPRENHAMAGLARVYVLREEAGPAVEWAEKAVQLRRRRAAYRVILGNAYALAGRTAEARQEYRRVLRDEPGNDAARRGLTELGN